MSLSAILPAVVAGLVGGFFALVAGWLAFTREWKRAREDQSTTAAVQLVQDIVTNLARAAQAMSWLAWRALHDPDQVNAESLGRYDWEVHELLPQIVGAQAALRAMRPDTAATLDPAIARLFENCALNNAASIPARTGDKTALGQRLAEAEAFEKELAEAVKGTSASLLATYGRAARRLRKREGSA